MVTEYCESVKTGKASSGKSLNSSGDMGLYLKGYTDGKSLVTDQKAITAEGGGDMNRTSHKTKWPDSVVLQEARLMANNKATGSEVSGATGVPLSTVNWHMRVRLKDLDEELYMEVSVVRRNNLKRRGL